MTSLLNTMVHGIEYPGRAEKRACVIESQTVDLSRVCGIRHDDKKSDVDITPTQ